MNTSYITLLPTEVLEQVFEQLSKNDLKLVCSVNQAFREIAQPLLLDVLHINYKALTMGAHESHNELATALKSWQNKGFRAPYRKLYIDGHSNIKNMHQKDMLDSLLALPYIKTVALRVSSTLQGDQATALLKQVGEWRATGGGGGKMLKVKLSYYGSPQQIASILNPDELVIQSAVVNPKHPHNNPGTFPLANIIQQSSSKLQVLRLCNMGMPFESIIKAYPDNTFPCLHTLMIAGHRYSEPSPPYPRHYNYNYYEKAVPWTTQYFPKVTNLTTIYFLPSRFWSSLSERMPNIKSLTVSGLDAALFNYLQTEQVQGTLVTLTLTASYSYALRIANSILPDSIEYSKLFYNTIVPMLSKLRHLDMAQISPETEEGPPHEAAHAWNPFNAGNRHSLKTLRTLTNFHYLDLYKDEEMDSLLDILHTIEQAPYMYEMWVDLRMADDEQKQSRFALTVQRFKTLLNQSSTILTRKTPLSVTFDNDISRATCKVTSCCGVSLHEHSVVKESR